MITFGQYYGTTEEEKTQQGARFVDSHRFEGPIPEMIKRVEIYVLAAMCKAVLGEKILAYIRAHGTIANAACRELLSVDLQRASSLLKKPTADGILK